MQTYKHQIKEPTEKHVCKFYNPIAIQLKWPVLISNHEFMHVNLQLHRWLYIDSYT